ncbi:hypothetical protein DFS34DRAFT_666372 [Phlyctochytrium arcticum]|nr:hypothetical protein DFS34DRAFT_666372 [Phlyctochytrium arcticum]
MTLIFNPLNKKNVRIGSKPFEKMMRKIVDGDFTRRNWTRNQREALEDIFIERLPVFLADKKEKNIAIARSRVEKLGSERRKEISRKAAATVRASRDREEIAQQAALEQQRRRLQEKAEQQKLRRQASARKAAATRKQNKQPPNSYAIEWVHLLYWCEFNDRPYYRDRKYTEGDRYAKSRDTRFSQIAAARNAKGEKWMSDIKKKQDEFENRYSESSHDGKTTTNKPHFREALSRDVNHVFTNVRGELDEKRTEQLIQDYEKENGVAMMDGDAYINDFIVLETYVLSCVNIETDVKFENMLLFDENQGENMCIRPNGVSEGQCVIKTIRNCWGYGSTRAKRKGVREIMDDSWLMKAMDLHSLNDGATVRNIESLSHELLKLGYGASYYIIDLLKNFIDRCSVSQETVYAQEKQNKNWHFKWSLLPSHGWLYNNHLSEIHDTSLQKSLHERVKTAANIDTSLIEMTKKKEKQTNKDDEVFYIKIETNDNVVEDIVDDIICYEDECIADKYIYILKDAHEYHIVEAIFLEYIKKTNIIPKVSCRSTTRSLATNIEKILLPSGNEIRLDQQFEKRKEIAEKLEIFLKDQSLTRISSEHFNLHYPNIEKSFLGKELRRILDQNGSGKPSIFYGNLQDSFNVSDMTAVDIPRCYRTSCYEMPLSYPVFSLYDNIEEYDHVISKNGKKAGWYFIKTDNVIPCEGDGWYSNVIVNKLIKENIPHEITRMIISSKYIPHDYFKSYIDDVANRLGYNDSKLPINSMIGLFS